MAETSFKECNRVLAQFGYRKLATWRPKYAKPVPPRRECALFDQKRNRCASLKMTYCQFEDCSFYQGKE